MGVTVKLVVLVAVPPGVVREIGPVVTPAGAVAVTWVAELTVNVVEIPLKRTADVPVRLVPGDDDGGAGPVHSWERRT